MGTEKGKEMKKIDVLKRSVVGVCAATLLTGLCVAPAFAVGVKAGGTDTAVPVTVDATNLQVSATVPTVIPLSFNASTGAVVTPTDTKIDATGGIAAVKVTNLVATAPTAGLTFAADKSPLTSNQMFLSVGGNVVTATKAAVVTPIKVDNTPIAIDAGFGTLSGATLKAIAGGTTASPAALFNLTMTLALDIPTA